MKQQSDTSPVRINKILLDKVRDIAKVKRQKITGYLELLIEKKIKDDWNKIQSKSSNP